MFCCEKCWGEAYGMAIDDPMKTQTECYRYLINSRKEKPCTPEEVAGECAGICPKCNRKTVHQHVKVCVNPGCANPLTTTV